MSDDSRSFSDERSQERGNEPSQKREGRTAQNGTGGSSEPRPRRTTNGESQNLLRRFWTAQSGPLLFIRETLTSVLAVALIGLLLFAISGVWPPMVAVESGSMEPHMEKGDLIFITEPGRFTPEAAYDKTGVVTYQRGKQVDYRSFGSYGSVVVYDSPSRAGPPVIHRARFWVNEGENWYDEADQSYIQADNCQQLPNCPAPHAGFITKGDANPTYDQVNGISTPVKPSWISGVAHVRIPYLGWVRLYFSKMLMLTVDVPSVGAGAATGLSVGTSMSTATP